MCRTLPACLPICLISLFAAGCLGRPVQGVNPYGQPQYVTLPPGSSGPIASPLPITPVPISNPQPNPVPGPVASPPAEPPIDGSGLTLTPASRRISSWNGPGYQPWRTPVAVPRTFAAPSGARYAGLGQAIDGRPLPYYLGTTALSRPLNSAAPSNHAPVSYPTEIASELPPTAQDDLKHRGGKTIPDLTYVNIYVGGPQAWNESDRKSIDWALNGAMTDPYLNHVLMQYFRDQPVSATYRGSFILNGFSPTRVTQGNLQQLVRLLDQMGSFSQLPTESTAVNFLLPKGVVLEDPGSAGTGAIPSSDEGNSLQGLGGYHGSVHIGNRTIYYAVGVYTERLADGRTNGVPVFEVPWKDICATMYHQLQEIRTDPDVDDAIATGLEKYVGWASDRGEEISDLPVKADSADGRLDQVFREVTLANGSGKVPVQFLYSNAIHAPEGPIERPHRGSPLPIPPATVPPWGSAPVPTPQPQPNNPPPTNGNDPNLDWIREEWDHLPASLKQRILDLIREGHSHSEEQPLGP